MICTKGDGSFWCKSETMNSKSKFDLDNEYRSLLSSLMDEALEVYRQYEYEDFTCSVYSVSYKRSLNWFYEGPLPRFEEDSRGIKEQEKLRKGTKNYFEIYKENGRIKKVVSYCGGSLDVTYFAVYRGNKRFLLPFSDEWKGRYPTYVIVAEYDDGEIAKEYLVNNTQIVFWRYEKLSFSEYFVETINYVAEGRVPLLGFESFTFSLSEEPHFSGIKSFNWQEELACSKKGLPYSSMLPEHIVCTNGDGSFWCK